MTRADAEKQQIWTFVGTTVDGQTFVRRENGAVKMAAYAETVDALTHSAFRAVADSVFIVICVEKHNTGGNE